MCTFSCIKLIPKFPKNVWCWETSNYSIIDVLAYKLINSDLQSAMLEKVTWIHKRGKWLMLEEQQVSNITSIYLNREREESKVQ